MSGNKYTFKTNEVGDERLLAEFRYGVDVWTQYMTTPAKRVALKYLLDKFGVTITPPIELP